MAIAKITRRYKKETYTVIVDDRDSDLFERYVYHAQVNLSGHIYIRRWVRVRGRKSYKHVNLAWDVYERYCGKIPHGILIDHKDTDTLNNRLDNLRLATRQQNRYNSRRSSKATSKYKGVIATKCGWDVSIYYKKKHISCKTFEKEVEAARLADKIYTMLYGEYAYLNFPKLRLLKYVK